MKIRLSRGLKMFILRLRKMTNRREKRFPITIKCIKRNGKQGKKNEKKNEKRNEKSGKRNGKNGKNIVTAAVDIPVFNIHASLIRTIIAFNIHASLIRTIIAFNIHPSLIHTITIVTKEHIQPRTFSPDNYAPSTTQTLTSTTPSSPSFTKWANPPRPSKPPPYHTLVWPISFTYATSSRTHPNTATRYGPLPRIGRTHSHRLPIKNRFRPRRSLQRPIQPPLHRPVANTVIVNLANHALLDHSTTSEPIQKGDSRPTKRTSRFTGSLSIPRVLTVTARVRTCRLRGRFVEG